MVPGMIMIWYGEAEDIPPGFAICDGANGTPDLRDKFVIGAGDSLNPGDVGGTATHTHDFTSNGHFHDLIPPVPSLGPGAYRSARTDVKTVAGITDAGSTIPPFHALLYMMYIGL